MIKIRIRINHLDQADGKQRKTKLTDQEQTDKDK